jgi:phosphatidylglycerophosphate synthase
MKRLVVNLIVLLLLLLAGNLAVAAVAITAAGPRASELSWGLAGIAVWHAIITTLLLRRRHDFILLPDRRRLHRVNFANVLTITRLSAAPTIAFVLIWGHGSTGVQVGVILTAAVFLTDLTDGQISRRTQQRTVIGAYLDSTTDYVLLIVISAVFVVRGLLSLWFVLLLGGRLLFQALTMLGVFLTRGRIEPRTSALGKASIAVAMVVYGISLLQVLTSADWAQTTVLVAEIVAAVVIGVSVIDKAVLGFRQMWTEEHTDGDAS